MTDQPSAPTDGTVTWHALTPQAALERQGVTVEHGLTQAEADARRAKYGAEQVRRAAEGATLAGVPAPVPRPDADRAAGGRRAQPVPARPGRHRRRAHRPDAAQRRDGPEPGGQGERERRRAPEDDGRLGQGPPRRLPRPAADGPARARGHRQHRGRRPRPGRRTRPHLGHPRDRRVRPDRRKRPGPQAGRGRRGERRARRPGRPGLHEHPGDARRGHDPGDQHRHDHRGRPHQRHAQRDEGRGHAADPSAQRVDQPDPGHRRCRAADLDRHRPVAEHPDRRAVPDRDRVRRVGHPDGPAGGGHGDPVEGDDDARLGRRHRQAAAVGRDARLDLGDQLRQDRHADAQPDDRGPDGRRPRSLRDHRRGLLHRGPDHPRGRPGRGTAGFAPPADGALRRCRDPRRRAGRRPDRRRARRPRGEGRGRPDPHSRALPARRDPPVRRRLQVHGDVPPDDG